MIRAFLEAHRVASIRRHSGFGKSDLRSLSNVDTFPV
jgi:hypothetical protein